eukprot:SAG11_NODE_2663_length_3118_cov_2.777079_3_plen_105_part_00
MAGRRIFYFPSTCSCARASLLLCTATLLLARRSVLHYFGAGAAVPKSLLLFDWDVHGADCGTFELDEHGPTALFVEKLTVCHGVQPGELPSALDGSLGKAKGRQ